MVAMFRCADARYEYLMGLLQRGDTIQRTAWTAGEVPATQAYKRQWVEILGETTGIEDCRRVMFSNPKLRFNPLWLCNEISCYINAGSQELPILKWLARDKVLKFHPTGRFEIPYGYTPESIEVLAHMLRANPESRRAVASFYPNDLFRLADADETPCALTTQYLLRGGMLWSISTYRSHDFFAGGKTDTIRISIVQQALASLLKAEPGPLIIQEGSLHYYPDRAKMPELITYNDTCLQEPWDVFEFSDDPLGELYDFDAAFRSGPAKAWTTGLKNLRLDRLLRMALDWYMPHG